MIGVLLECTSPDCLNEEYVDVYHDHWSRGIPVSRYLPEDWTVHPGIYGYPIVYCGDCSE
ncbi:hypothetical protein [Mycobacterium phage WXIN]|nr:hypothetical protein [Mycobacterium phage WXIN]